MKGSVNQRLKQTSEFDPRSADIEGCQREIAAIEAQIRAGHPDLEGLCLALADWSAELRLLRANVGLATVAQRLAHVRSCGDGLACSTKAAGIRSVGQESRPGERKPARAVPGGLGRRA